MKKTLFFDFAGVVTTKKCFPALAEKLEQETGVSRAEIEDRLYSNEADYMTGKESTEEFWSRTLKDIVPFKIFLTAFRTWFDLNPAVLMLIRKMKKKHQVVLLSDNFEVVSTKLRKDAKFKALFEKMFFSNEIGFAKTDAEFLKIVLDDLKEKPGDCVMIDDKEKNLVQAKSLGMKTVLFQNAGQLKEGLGKMNF